LRPTARACRTVFPSSPRLPAPARPTWARSWLSRTANTGCMGCSFIPNPYFRPTANKYLRIFSRLYKKMMRGIRH